MTYARSHRRQEDRGPPGEEAADQARLQAHGLGEADPAHGRPGESHGRGQVRGRHPPPRHALRRDPQAAGPWRQAQERGHVRGREGPGRAGRPRRRSRRRSPREAGRRGRGPRPRQVRVRAFPVEARQRQDLRPPEGGHAADRCRRRVGEPRRGRQARDEDGREVLFRPVRRPRPVRAAHGRRAHRRRQGRGLGLDPVALPGPAGGRPDAGPGRAERPRPRRPSSAAGSAARTRAPRSSRRRAWPSSPANPCRSPGRARRSSSTTPSARPRSTTSARASTPQNRIVLWDYKNYHAGSRSSQPVYDIPHKRVPGIGGGFGGGGRASIPSAPAPGAGPAATPTSSPPNPTSTSWPRRPAWTRSRSGSPTWPTRG